MNTKSGHIIRNIFQSLFELKETERLWHIPVLASLCSGIPLLVGLYFNHFNEGLLASTAGLVILYLPMAGVAERMITLLSCSFGLMISLPLESFSVLIPSYLRWYWVC